MTTPLQINGWSVPVAAPSATRGEESIGGVERTVNGRLSRTRSALLDTYEGMIALGDGELARAFRALVQGRGHRLDCENTTYTSKGLAPTGSAVFRSSGAVVDTGGTSRTDPKFGSYCLALEAAVKNWLTQNVRTGTDSGTNTTGFEASVAGAASAGATLTSSTTTAWQGSRSLKTVTTAVANQGFRTTVINPAGANVCGSVYLKADSGTPQVKVFLYDNTAAAAGTKTTVTLSSTAWQRVEVVATGTSGHNWCLCVEQVAAGITTFYADGLQLEASTFAGTWVGSSAGSTQTQAAANLSYSLREMKTRDDFTLMCWARQPIQAGGATSRLFTLGTENDGIRCYVTGPGAAGAAVYLEARVAGATTGQAFLQDAFDDGAWHHVACVVRRDPQTGSYGLEVYYDGVCPFDGNANVSATMPATGNAPTLYLGTTASGTSPWGGLVDELVVLPWSPTLAQVAAWSTRVFSDLPELLVCGSHLGTATGDETAFLGEVTGHSVTMGQIGGVWRADAATVGFRLREVG